MKSNYSKFRFYSTDLALVLLAGISLHVVAIFTLWTNYKEKEKQKRNYIKGVQRKLEIANTYNLRTDEFVEVICSEHTNTMECYAKLILKDKLEEIAVVRKSGQIQLEQMVDNFSCFQVTYKPKN